MKALLTFFILLSVSYKIKSQPDTARVKKKQISIGLGTGINIISFKDVSSSPLAYSGFGLPAALQLQLRKDKVIHTLEVQIISEVISNNYPLSSQSNTQLKTYENASLRYSLLYRSKDGPNYLGGSLNSAIFYREFNFLDGQSYEFINSLDFNFMRNFLVSERLKFETCFALPFFANIHRKPSLTLEEAFLDDLHKGNSVLKYGKYRAIFNDWFGFRASVQSTYELNDRMFITAEIGLSYYSIAFPERVKTINYPITCFINYQL